MPATSIKVVYNGSEYEYCFAPASRTSERGYWSGIRGPDRNMIPSVITQNHLRAIAIENGTKPEAFLFSKPKPVSVSRQRSPKAETGISVFGPANLARLADIERKLDRILA